MVGAEDRAGFRFGISGTPDFSGFSTTKNRAGSHITIRANAAEFIGIPLILRVAQAKCLQFFKMHGMRSVIQTVV